MTRRIEARRLLGALGSLKLTIFCLALMLALVFLGTLAQVPLGTYAAQKIYFDSVWIYGALPGGWRVPVFPGGLLVGGLWFVNLIAAHTVRFQWSRKKAGIFLIHFGLALLLLGQFFTQMWARESQMAIEEGASANFSESARDTELVVIDASDPQVDRVVSVPESRFRREGEIRGPGLPFALVVKKFFPNAHLSMAAPGVAAAGPATAGIGRQIAVSEAPVAAADDEVNSVTAFVEVRTESESLGTWLLSSGLAAPQPFTFQGKEYRLAIRPRRAYYPFTVTLKDFRHDRYLGTEVPKNFSSLIRLTHSAKHEDRDVLISMNRPLRYEGKAFYQASFGKGDTLSVLQVVENPAWLTPYVAASLMAAGLGVQFLSHLISFARKTA
jgi:hypothetical protein